MDIKTTEAITSVVVVLSCTTSVVPMLLIHRLEAESRGDAIGIPCGVTAAAPFVYTKQKLVLLP